MEKNYIMSIETEVKDEQPKVDKIDLETPEIKETKNVEIYVTGFTLFAKTL
jgi:hypothetical protein